MNEMYYLNSKGNVEKYIPFHFVSVKTLTIILNLFCKFDICVEKKHIIAHIFLTAVSAVVVHDQLPA